ncbi:MAG TPA: DUF2793 domain-containing protein [Sphingomicrobium sp.]|nr:DUF2793 domain-containing protein [Sphingomicrobium sp.]
MDLTQRLSMPMLVPGQAQKELTHNEALLLLDTIVCGAVEEGARDDPPPAPVTGQCYIVGTSPSGEWAQYPSHLAAFTIGGWRFVAPFEGLAVFVKANSIIARYVTGAWEVGTLRSSRLLVDGKQVVGQQVAAIAEPSGGTSVDGEARIAIGEILAALRQHGLVAVS